MQKQDNTDWKAVAEMQRKFVLERLGYDLHQEVLPVSDGCIIKFSSVWWKSEDGPEDVVATGEHWLNIRQFPEHYCINKPKYKVTYLD